MIRISADILYLDGPLAGTVIPDGYQVGVAALHQAPRYTTWMERVRSSGDFVRAAVTGHRYQLVSPPRVVDLSVGAGA